ncbi:FAD-binding oxidoreductase [Herbaspirillum sp. YR522]|uniref:NAD(P)/FAD-dependent oxidoreductase n=1 Tax=Herbaspirillum sp. YR522 TaxID=1144342 RepID=UPI00026FB3D0|nr:FAD-binding oxidoreductase [Herbaspirillum sp. YR522]EJN00326.1 glycine/D-amino acid oxidase, deaminating [Herbaspirillum sp. YR522]
MNTYDAIVIGAGVIGTSTAFHLAQLGARNVLLLDRKTVGEGTTSQSSGILRTHYSVQENVELAQLSWQTFNNFAQYLEDDEASCGLVKCGYMIWAPEGDKLEPLRASLEAQHQQGIPLQTLDASQASELLPIARFDDAALISFEPEAGFADAYLVATSFARAARRRGVTVKEGVNVERLIVDNGRVVGVDTSAGRFLSDQVVSTQNIWTPELAAWTGLSLPVRAERHTVLALEGPEAYTFNMPVFKDLASSGMLYGRSYGGTQMLVSEGVVGETLDSPDTEQGDVSLDAIVEIGAQVAERFPSFETAGLATSWTGVYDVTPDWNPVLGQLPGIEGLSTGFGFSGHGFKLSPAVGRILAQQALGMPTDVSLAPYSIERFASGKLLVGKYGSGAVS